MGVPGALRSVFSLLFVCQSLEIRHFVWGVNLNPNGGDYRVGQRKLIVCTVELITLM